MPASCAYCLTNLGRKSPNRPRRSSQTRICPSQAERGADPDRGHRHGLGDAARERLDDALDHHREGAGVGHRPRVGNDPLGIGLDLAAGTIAAIGVDRLWLQPDMAQNRHAPVDQEGDGLGHRCTAFELHPDTAGLGHDPGGAAKSLGGTLLVAAERKIDDHERRLGPAHDGAAMRDHHVQGHRHGARQPVDHHAEAVAHQQQIAGRSSSRAMGVV